jgi:outer membrane receptor protein involved in Fe transport
MAIGKSHGRVRRAPGGMARLLAGVLVFWQTAVASAEWSTPPDYGSRYAAAPASFSAVDFVQPADEAVLPEAEADLAPLLELEQLLSQPVLTPVEQLAQTEITAASRIPERGSDAPATVYLITKEDIRNRGYSNLRDVLRDVPGMETIDFYQTEKGTLVPVRGVVGNNKIIFLVNGMRVNPPGGEEMMLRSDFSVRMAERIEIVYGPGSMIWGQDAISAIVNVITRESDAGEVLSSYGQRDFYEGFAGISTTLGCNPCNPIRITAFFAATHSGLTDLSKEYPAWWAGFNTAQVGAPDSPRRWDEGYNAFFRIENNESSFQAWFRDSSRSSAEGRARPVLYYVDEAIWRDQSFVMEAKNRHEFTDRASLTSKVVYNYYEIAPETRYVFKASPTELFYDDFKYGVGSGAWVTELLTLEFSERFTLMLGFEAAFFDIIPKATIPGGADPSQSIVPQGGAFTYYTGDPLSPPLTENTVPRVTNLTYQNFGYFLQSRFALTDSLSVVGGFRIDHNTRYSDHAVSPRAALIYHNDAQNLTLKYIYSQAFVGPAPYFGYNVFLNSVQLNTSNPNLEPETADSHEINLTWFGENTMLGSSVYFNSQQNLFLPGELRLPVNILPESPVYLDEAGTDPRILTQSANGGDNTVFGFDLYGRYEADRLSLWTSYSYVDVHNVTEGVESGLPQISRHNFRLGFTWDILDNLKLTPSVIYRSTPENIVDTQDLAKELRNPTVFNLYLLYTPWKNIDVFADFRNVADRRYALQGVGGPTPKEIFHASTGVRWRF